MLLIEATIRELIEYVNLWNNEFALNMKFHGHYGKHTAWTVANVLITGIEIAPGRILCEFDNFDLQATDKEVRKALTRLNELLYESFVVDNTQTASRIYGVMERQSTRTLRVIPAFFADTKLDAKTEADFKLTLREKNPDVTEDELVASWRSFCELVEEQRTKRVEQERRRGMTAEDAVADWRKIVRSKVESQASQSQSLEDEKSEEYLLKRGQSEATVVRSTMDSNAKDRRESIRDGERIKPAKR